MEEELEQFLEEDCNLDWTLGFETVEENLAGDNQLTTDNDEYETFQSGIIHNEDLILENDIPTISEIIIDTASVPKRRGRPPLNLSEAQKLERKKEINRKAAQRYRRKKKSETARQSLLTTQEKNRQLKARVKHLMDKITMIKTSLNI